jgi:hypothetical protein
MRTNFRSGAARAMTVLAIGLMAASVLAVAPRAGAVAQAARPRLFGFLEITAGRLLVSVRRPARVTVFANGHRLARFRARRERVYEIQVHRRGRIRVVAVAGRRRQTVILHVR